LKVLVTGGAGFIGSHLVDLLIAEGFTVAVVDDLSHGKRENVHPKATFFHEEITSPRIERIFSTFKPNVVSHHAALVSVPQSQRYPLKDADTNVVGTLKLLEAGKKSGISQFIFASSVAVYGNTDHLPIKETEPRRPISIYGVSKATAELYVGLYQESFTTTIFRYANVYGPRQDASAEGGVVAIFCEQLKKRQPVTIFGDGKQTRDFVFVGDVARASKQAILKRKGGIFNVSTGQATSINQLYTLLEKGAGSSDKPFHTKARAGDIRQSVLDNHMAQEKLTWQPNLSLQEGLKLAWESFT
jgi:UDP-glucose 4-epimerase